MGLLTDADRAAMRADLLAVRDDNSVSIVLRRGATTLSTQTVRIAKMQSQSHRKGADGIVHSEQRVVVVGDVTLDIQLDDRFTVDGDLYEVDFVRPNRVAAIVAEARVIE